MGHGHDHSAGDAAVPRRYRRLLAAIAAALGVVTIAGVVVLWPSHSVRGDVSKLGLISKVYSATVVKVAARSVRRSRWRFHQGQVLTGHVQAHARPRLGPAQDHRVRRLPERA